MYLWPFLNGQIRPGTIGDVHCGRLVSGVTVPCNPNLTNAPRMIPAGIATYCRFLGHLDGILIIAIRTSLARFVASALLSQEEMRAMGLKELSCRT